jgi:predicted NBD/HSP70 family sugar kinase
MTGPVVSGTPRRDDGPRGARARVGVDVGGSSVRVLAEVDGVRRDVVAADVPGSYDDFLALVARLRDCALRGATTHAVGCGLPGTSDGGRAGFVPALPWIEGRPVADDLARVFGAPVVLGLDGHLTLLAEAMEGAAAGCRSAVLVAVGTGIGGAVLLGGRIWRGHHGSAGSCGWLPAAGARDDAHHGPFEQVASGSALAARARALDPSLTARALVEAARRGEPAAAAEVDAYGQQLGRGIAALASVLDPEVVLVGGGLSAAMDVLAPAIRRATTSVASPDGRSVPVRATALGPDAGVVGALRAAAAGEDVWL